MDFAKKLGYGLKAIFFFGLRGILPILFFILFVSLLLIMMVAKTAYHEIPYYFSDKYKVEYTDKSTTTHQGKEIPVTENLLACVVDNPKALKTTAAVESYITKRLDLTITPQSSLVVKKIEDCPNDLYLNGGMLIQVGGESGVKESFNKNIKVVFDGLR